MRVLTLMKLDPNLKISFASYLGFFFLHSRLHRSSDFSEGSGGGEKNLISVNVSVWIRSSSSSYSSSSSSSSCSSTVKWNEEEGRIIVGTTTTTMRVGCLPLPHILLPLPLLSRQWVEFCCSERGLGRLAQTLSLSYLYSSRHLYRICKGEEREASKQQLQKLEEGGRKFNLFFFRLPLLPSDFLVGSSVAKRAHLIAKNCIPDIVYLPRSPCS